MAVSKRLNSPHSHIKGRSVVKACWADVPCVCCRGVHCGNKAKGQQHALNMCGGIAVNTVLFFSEVSRCNSMTCMRAHACRIMCLSCGLCSTFWCLGSLVRRNSSMRDMANPSSRAGMQNRHPKSRKQVCACSYNNYCLHIVVLACAQQLFVPLASVCRFWYIVFSIQINSVQF